MATAAAGTELAEASSVANVKRGAINTTPFLTTESTLQPEGLLHTRGMAASGFRPLCNIPHCCLRRSLTVAPSSSVADHPLRPAREVALVSHYLTN